MMRIFIWLSATFSTLVIFAFLVWWVLRDTAIFVGLVGVSFIFVICAFLVWWISQDTTEPLQTKTEARSRDILKDSALVVAIATGLLYVWGTTSYYSGVYGSGVPIDFQYELSTEQFLFEGAYNAIVALPIGLLCWIVGDRSLGGAPNRFIRSLHQRELSVLFMFYGFLLVGSIFFLSLAVHVPRVLIRGLPNTFFPVKSNVVVKRIRLSDKSNSIAKYEGLVFIAKRGNRFVFRDQGSGSRPTIFIVDENEVKELILGPPE